MTTINKLRNQTMTLADKTQNMIDANVASGEPTMRLEMALECYVQAIRYLENKTDNGAFMAFDLALGGELGDMGEH